MNRRTLKKTSEIEYMFEEGESEKNPKRYSHRRREASGQKKSPRGEKREQTPQYRDTREEMERGREGKTEVKAIGQ